jgi:hypothetical protein
VGDRPLHAARVASESCSDPKLDTRKLAALPLENLVKFHLPSYLLGVLSAAVAVKLGDRVRPIVVETLSLASVVWTAGRSVIEQQREALEDLWAEIRERSRNRAGRDRANGYRRDGAAEADA